MLFPQNHEDTAGLWHFLG